MASVDPTKTIWAIMPGEPIWEAMDLTAAERVALTAYWQHHPRSTARTEYSLNVRGEITGVFHVHRCDECETLLAEFDDEDPSAGRCDGIKLLSRGIPSLQELGPLAGVHEILDALRNPTRDAPEGTTRDTPH